MDDVQVALIADSERPFEPGPIGEAAYRQPYAERTKVILSVDEDDTLAGVLERAAAAMGLQPPSNSWSDGGFSARHRKIAFFKPEDDGGFAQRPQGRLLSSELILADREGHAVFGIHDLRAVRYADLLHSAEAGTIDGDPLRPYLILDDGWGDVPPVDWATVQEGLEVAWEVLKAIGVVGGAATGIHQVVKRFKERLSRGREALAANGEWAQRGYRPDQFAALLAVREWQAEDLASLLGCTPAEAEAVLWVMGYVFKDEAGQWELRGDEAAGMLAGTIQAIEYAEHSRYEGWQPAFRRWLVAYIETGKAPPLKMLDPAPPEEEELDDPDLTLGQRLDNALARLRGIGR